MRALLLIAWSCSSLGDFAPPRVTVDLDVDAEHRWDHVVAERRDSTRKLIEEVFADPKIKNYIAPAKLLLGNALEGRRLLPGDLYVEAKSIARGLGVEIADLVLIGAFYDLFAAAQTPLKERACTGIVAQSTSGEIFHGRNLDYDFARLLANATIVVDFARNGSTLFTAVTFGPNPTFNTAVRYGTFSITQDERDRGSVLTNLWNMLVLGRPALFAQIRMAMETVQSFEEAVSYFSDLELNAASYFIIGGTKPGEGAVVTRDRSSVVDVWRLNASAGQWYILETNYDHKLAPPKGDDRRDPLKRALNATGPSGFTAGNMFDIISVDHVNTTAGERAPLNDDTVYSTVMQASNPKTFGTVVRSPRPHQDVTLVV